MPGDYEDLIAAADEVPLGGGVTENDLAALFYTSGTTGAAKQRRGKVPLTETTPNGHEVPPPQRPAKVPAKTQAKAPVKAKAKAKEPAVRKPSPYDILGLTETAGALRFLGQMALRYPQAVLRTAPELGQEMLKISLGKSEVAPQKGDKRFTDPAWQQNPLLRATMQSYLTWGTGLERYIDNLGMTGMGVERLRFGAVLLRESMAPTNFLAANPAAVKRFYDTGGASLRGGLANWAGDLMHNHGMPSMVDRRPFCIGENLATSRGAVIYRNEVFELIQYTPQRGSVYSRPVLMVPPQVNKYYALDSRPAAACTSTCSSAASRCTGSAGATRQGRSATGTSTPTCRRRSTRSMRSARSPARPT